MRQRASRLRVEMSIAIENRPAASQEYVTVAMSAAFVFLWSSGFIGAKFGLPFAGSFTFLSLRFLLAAALLLPFLILLRTPWPSSWRDAGHVAMSGLLLNVGCLGSCFYAMSLGLPGATVAVIGGLQPLLTGILAAYLLRETVTSRHWLGLGLGFGGVVLVLSDRLSLGQAPFAAVGFAFLGLMCITLATLYQKRFGGKVPLRSGAAIQLGMSALACLPFAVLIEGFEVHWSPSFVLALLWLAGPLSLGALTLLWLLVRRGAASKVSSLFYLTPPMTALMAWVLFNERLGTAALIGMAVVVAGVALATQQNQPAIAKTAS
jgi:drug/metabolite transporter (DMT)-like permease